MGSLVRHSAVWVALALLVVVRRPPRPTGRSRTPAAVRWLNDLREASGIPGHVTQNPTWSSKCLRHVRWMERNNALQHYETPGTPGYSAAGDWAGSNAVLAAGTQWTASHLPWLTAPIHLAQLLAPGLTEVGVAYERGWSCATTWPGYSRRDGRAALYSYPANGARDVPTGMVAYEAPFSPGQAVGIPAGSETGPYLYVFADGGWAAGLPHVTSATLSAAGGAPVAVRHVACRRRKSALPAAGKRDADTRPPPVGGHGLRPSVTLGTASERRTLRWQFRPEAQRALTTSTAFMPSFRWFAMLHQSR